VSKSVLKEKYSTVIKEAHVEVGGATYKLVTDGEPYDYTDQGLENMFGISTVAAQTGKRVRSCKAEALGLDSATSPAGPAAWPRTDAEIGSVVCNGESTDAAPGCLWDLNHPMAACAGCADKAFDALAFSSERLQGSDAVVSITTISFDCERLNEVSDRAVNLRGSGIMVEQTHSVAFTRDGSESGASTASLSLSVAARDAEEPYSDGEHAGHSEDKKGAHPHDASAAAIVACCIGGVLLLIVSVHLVQVHALGVKGLLSAESKARFEKKRRVDQKFNDQPSALLVPRKMIVPGRM
jgi:hypothetical protein